jgi:putative transcriptional regulator
VAKTKAKATIGQQLVSSMQSAVAALKRGEPLTFRTVVMQLEPTTYNPKKLVGTRDLLAVSQGMFAQFLGVSPATIRAWEQGTKEPSDMAKRFLDEIRRNPDYWRQRMCESVKLKTVVR